MWEEGPRKRLWVLCEAVTPIPHQRWRQRMSERKGMVRDARLQTLPSATKPAVLGLHSASPPANGPVSRSAFQEAGPPGEPPTGHSPGPASPCSGAEQGVTDRTKSLQGRILHAGRSHRSGQRLPSATSKTTRPEIAPYFLRKQESQAVPPSPRKVLAQKLSAIQSTEAHLRRKSVPRPTSDHSGL